MAITKPNVTDQMYAEKIATEYGFQPIPNGKFEPYWTGYRKEFYFVFAHWLNHTNVLIKFDAEQF